MIGKWKKKSSFSKLHWTTKILIVYLIKNSSLFYFLPKKWCSCDCFFFPASEAPKNFWGPQKRFKFWILDLKVCLKKLGIGPGLYEKSVLYLKYSDYAVTKRQQMQSGQILTTWKILKTSLNKYDISLSFSVIYHTHYS